MKRHYELTEEGKNYLENGLPELNLVDALKDGPLELAIVKKRIDNFNVALQWAKKSGMIETKDGMIELVGEVKESGLPDALKKIEEGKKLDDEKLNLLIKRKLVKKIVRGEVDKLVGKEVVNLSPKLLKTGLWKEVKFKPYNVTAVGKRIYPGKLHILSIFEQKVRRIYTDLGFHEHEGPFVESNFWNFDALFQPQDHPARDLADTFYVKTPVKAKLPEKYVPTVKSTHEDGWKTGSLGWRYKWSPDFASKNVMRTHMTAVSVRSLAKMKPPFKVFSIGRVYRNETIDYKHLPEFVQVDGVCVDENITFKNLLGYLKEFYLRLGFKKVRFTPSYFPYTEMSTQIEVFFEDRKEWLEFGGSGVFRPEVTEPFGITEPTIAWGLGFERPIMLKLAWNDIRNFYYRNDLKKLREVSLLQ
jgi:phenylalanyl-tRNA synthetase alpha chain